MPFNFLAARAAFIATTIFLISPATSQTAVPLRGSVEADDLKQRETDLGALRAEQHRSAEAARKLEGEIDSIGEDRRKLNQSLIDAATRFARWKENRRHTGAIEAPR